MDWRLVVVKKALLALVPFGDSLRRAKRRRVGYLPDIGNLETTLENYANICTAARDAGRPVAGARVLEIGSGWFPVIPIMLWLDGARDIVMTDFNPHMDEVTFAAALGYLRERFPERSALRVIHRLSDFPVRYLAPFAAPDLADASIDLVVSCAVLEHIEPEAITTLLASLRPKLARGGRMVHLVDHSDHLQHLDRGLSQVNFLSWGSGRHDLINRLIGEGENRLRHHQYPPIFERAGLELVSEQGDPHPAALRSLQGLRLAPPFDGMSPEQLSVLVSVYAMKAEAEI